MEILAILANWTVSPTMSMLKEERQHFTNTIIGDGRDFKVERPYAKIVGRGVSPFTAQNTHGEAFC
jgi:hypothetical protein